MALIVVAAAVVFLTSIRISAQQFISSTTTISSRSSTSYYVGVNYCPRGQSGFFPDPTNSSNYLECTDGTPTYLHQCPTRLYFITAAVGFGYCTLPARTQYPPPLGDVPPPDNNGQWQSSTPQTQFVCPSFLACNRTNVNGYYGDPRNCSRYYLCSGGRAFINYCPSGMTWTNRTGQCGWPSATGCFPNQPTWDVPMPCTNPNEAWMSRGSFWCILAALSLILVICCR